MRKIMEQVTKKRWFGEPVTVWRCTYYRWFPPKAVQGEGATPKQAEAEAASKWSME